MASTPPENEIPPVPVPPPGMAVGTPRLDDAPDPAIAPPIFPPAASPLPVAPTPVEPAPAAPDAASASASPAPPQPLPPVTSASAQPATAPARPDPYAAPGQQPSFAAQQSPQQSQQQPYAYAPVAAGPNQTLSILAMVAGIIGLLGSLVGLGFLPALAGVITGHIAQKRQPWAKAFWITALITGYVGVGISLIAGLFVLIAILAAVAGNS